MGVLFALAVTLFSPLFVAVWVGVPIAMALGATMAPSVARDDRFHWPRVAAIAGLCTLVGAAAAALAVTLAAAWTASPEQVVSPFTLIDDGVQLMLSGLFYLGPHSFLALLVPSAAWLWLMRRVAR